MNLPIDAVPDMTNVQVQVVTDAGALSPVEVERYVTYPVEWAMGGLPDVEEVRSISRFGISVVTVVFKERTDIYWARQQVANRITQAESNIPPGYGKPELGPLTTALGEILQFEVRGEGYTADGTADHSGLGHRPPAPRSRRRHRNQHPRRVLQNLRSPPQSRPADQLRNLFGRSVPAARKQQRHGRRRIRGASWRAAVHSRPVAVEK